MVGGDRLAHGPAAHAQAQVQELSLVELNGWFWQNDCITLTHYTYILCDNKRLNGLWDIHTLLWLSVVLNPFLTHKEVNSEDETKQFQFTPSPDKEKTKNKTYWSHKNMTQQSESCESAFSKMRKWQSLFILIYFQINEKKRVSLKNNFNPLINHVW